MVTKEDCLKMLNSIAFTEHGYIIPNNKLIFDSSKKYGVTYRLDKVEVKECIEYLKNMLGD